VDAAIDEGDRLELGAAKVQAPDLTPLEHDLLELGTGEVDVAEVGAPHPDPGPRRSDEGDRPETAARDLGIAPVGIGQVHGRRVEVGQERVGDARTAERGAIEATALEAAFEEAGVRGVRSGELKADEVDRDVVTARPERLIMERGEGRQSDLTLRRWSSLG
jgi:hypothetical protein